MIDSPVPMSCYNYNYQEKYWNSEPSEIRKVHTMRLIQNTILTVCLSMLATTCVDQSPELVIYNASPVDDSCMGKPIETVFLARGKYDVFCGNNYSVWFEVWSYLIERGDIEKPRAETNLVKLERAEVQVMTADGAEIIPRFSDSITGTVLPGKADEPGKTVVLIDIIPAQEQVLAAIDRFIDQKIVANIKVFGTTSGDVDVESAEFQFPIVICDTCFTVLVNSCVFTDTEIQRAEEAGGCQSGNGYDGDLCWCDNRASSTGRCEPCFR